MLAASYNVLNFVFHFVLPFISGLINPSIGHSDDQGWGQVLPGLDAGQDGRKWRTKFKTKWDGGPPLPLGRLLLSQAVQRAETQHQVHGVNTDHRPVRKQFAQGAQGDAVIRIVERWHNHCGVSDIEVGVAGR